MLVSFDLPRMQKIQVAMLQCLAPIHIVQRGYNRSICFTYDEGIATFPNCIRYSSAKFGVAMHSQVAIDGDEGISIDQIGSGTWY
jgi:hypothetical protein